MEIKLQNNFIRAYKKAAVNNLPADNKKMSAAKKSSNFDKVDFNFEAAVSAAKANITSSIEADAGAARLKELQAKYAGDSCPVSCEDAAGAIFG